MGKGILNRGTQVHQIKTRYNRLQVARKYKCEDDMSGGHFEHLQNGLKKHVETLKEDIRLNKPEFPDDVLKDLTYIRFVMEKAYSLMDEADWLYSGNISEESFKEEVHSLRKKLITNTG